LKFSVTNHAALVPFDDAAVKYLSGCHVGEVLQITNPLDESEVKFRAFVFMTLTKVAAAHRITIDQLRAKLQIESGRYQIIKVNDRNVVAVKSMNIQTMGHDELKEFWDDARGIIESMLVILGDEKAEEIEKLINS